MLDRLNDSHDPHTMARDFAYERALLTDSGIFDAESYVAKAGEEARPDPIGHYLQQGWRLGLEPNDAFPGSFFQPYFASIHRDGPPAITWLTLRSAGWSMLGSREEIEGLAERVRNSGLFSDSYYATQLPSGTDLDRAIHYVIVGERMGLAPSPDFDSAYYAARNPDVRL